MGGERVRLEGKVAVVTGGGRGVGRAVALALAGARVHVVARTAAEVEETAQLIVENGGEGWAIAMDLLPAKRKCRLPRLPSCHSIP